MTFTKCRHNPKLIPIPKKTFIQTSTVGYRDREYPSYCYQIPTANEWQGHCHQMFAQHYIYSLIITVLIVYSNAMLGSLTDTY